MATFLRPTPHYKPIIVRGELRQTTLAETHDGSSPDYEFGEDSGHCSRTFYTDWDIDPEKIAVIAEDILGECHIAYHKTTKFISRTIPVEHDNFLDRLFATNVRISGRKGEPIGADVNDIQAFDEAYVHITYNQLPYPVLTDNELRAAVSATGVPVETVYPDESLLLRYVTVDQQTGAKYQTIPNLAPLVWTTRAGALARDAVTDDGPNPGDAVLFKSAMILFEGDLVITWHEVPLEAYPISAITALVGKTNGSSFGHAQSVVGVYPAEKLVCGPPKRKLRRMRNGSFGYDITYTFKYYPQGANKNFFMAKGKTAGYYPFATDRNGAKKLFPLDSDDTPENPAGFYSFADLFRPEQA